jgi:hypothetical protein
LEIGMTWKDKLEIGLKEDAPFRKDNLPEQQVRGPEIPAGPGRSPVIPAAKAEAESVPPPPAPKPDDESDEDDLPPQE